MRMLHAAANWTRQLFRTRQFEREMQNEMQSHIEQQAAIYVARGMSERDAMAEARREFGNVGYLQEQARDSRGTRLVEETKRDLFYGFRALGRTPGFAFVAILSLTLGIGANTAMFTLIRYVLAPEHVNNPSTFVRYNVGISARTFRTISETPNLFSSTVAYTTDRLALRREGKSPVEASVELVTDGYFSVYDSRPMLGRLLLPGEERNGGGAVAVLSYNFWLNEFGGDTAIVGKTMRFANSSIFEIVGVTRREFTGAHARGSDMWLPLGARAAMQKQADSSGVSTSAVEEVGRVLFMSARLAPGVSIKNARLRLISVLSQLDHGDADPASRVNQALVSGTDSGLNRGNGAAVVFIFSATLFVLLIGCANVANLVMARGVRRRREIAVRLSLGASRVRLVRQLMTENAILAAIGGSLALVLNVVVLRIIAASTLFQQTLHAQADTIAQFLRPDATIVAFAFVVAFLSATASGLLPAMQTTKMDLSSATRDDGSALGNRVSRSRFRTSLVVGQVAMSLVLLISSSVLLRSANNVQTMDVGFDREHLNAVSTTFRQAGISKAQHDEFTRSYEAKLISLFGESNVARGSLPMQPTRSVRLNPKEAEPIVGDIMRASANYFEVLDIPILRGRSFTESEARNALPLVVLSERGARRLWPDENAIGKRITVRHSPSSSRSDSASALEQELTVIGVARDAQLTQLDYTPGMLLYVPTDTGPFLVRAPDPVKSLTVLREAARVSDPDVLVKVQTIEELIVGRGPAQGAGVVAMGATALGISALLLSVMGIFGVVAYAVSQRTREIGVRLAIGAQQGDVLRMIIRQGMGPVLTGAVIGLLVALMCTRLLDVFLFGVQPFDLMGYLSAITFVSGAALLACYFPARRATTIDPVGALRAD